VPVPAVRPALVASRAAVWLKKLAALSATSKIWSSSCWVAAVRVMAWAPAPVKAWVAMAPGTWAATPGISVMRPATLKAASPVKRTSSRMSTR
jgi:hypothetical protein